jgi:hypothetical protein
MTPQEFLQKLQIELKISKNSNYTIRNYLRANKGLLDFIGKEPQDITEDNVKAFMAAKLTNQSSSTIIVFLDRKSVV